MFTGRRSIVDEFKEQRQKEEEKQKRRIENLKLACKEVFSNVNAKFFLKFLKEICLWAEQDENINNEILIYKKGRRDVWTIVRNILPKDVLAQIEIYSDTEE